MTTHPLPGDQIPGLDRITVRLEWAGTAWELIIPNPSRPSMTLTLPDLCLPEIGPFDPGALDQVPSTPARRVTLVFDADPDDAGQFLTWREVSP